LTPLCSKRLPSISSPRMRVVQTALGAALAASVSGLRKSRSEEGTKLIAGVPIHNYQLRHTQNNFVAVDDTQPIDYEWVVMFKEGRNDASLQAFCGGGVGQGACHVMGHPSQGGVAFVAMRGTEEKLMSMLQRYPDDVEFAEPDLGVFTIPELPSDASSSDHWGLDRMNLQRARHTGKGVHIYVMDTGTRVSHEDFGGRAIATIDTIAGGGNVVECEQSSDPLCGQDTHGHGTHTAGSAGGTTYGVAKDAIVHGMRVCCGSGTNTLAGLDWIARKAIMPALVTMSLGSWGQSSSSKTAVEAVVDKGIAVFVSAGNNNVDACRKTYAFIPATITVGASTEADSRASWSNYGSCVDIWAPGSNIPSAGHRDDTSMRLMSGTSMATPLAAGAGALLLEQNPSMSPQKLKVQLASMATKDALSDLKDGDTNDLVNVR